jgi:3-dehydroquinate synthetase
VGIVAAARISQQLGMLKPESVQAIRSLLEKFELPVSCPGISPDSIINAIRFDKKTSLGQSRWVLVKGIGQGITGQTVAEEVVGKVIKELCR